MTQEDLGQELRENNDKIVECILLLRQQREELCYIIEKQYDERKKLETEMERITYKLCLVSSFFRNFKITKFSWLLTFQINKSLTQRLKAKTNYDKTLEEIEENYAKLVKNSGALLLVIQKEFAKLDSLLNKHTSTDDVPKEGARYI